MAALESGFGSEGFLLAAPDRRAIATRVSSGLDWRCLQRVSALVELFVASGFREDEMHDSVYKVITIVGTSTESWEKAAKFAVERASESLRDLRIAQVEEQDLVIENGKVGGYRVKLKVSFKYEGKH
jgi:flavin-binding protein dodecin